MNAHLDEALLAELARAKGDQLRSAVLDRMRVQQSARVDALIGQLFDIARELRQLNQDFTASRLPRP